MVTSSNATSSSFNSCSSSPCTWQEILLSPLFKNYPVILFSALACFVVQSACANLSRLVLFPKVYCSLSKVDRRAWTVRMVAFIHSLVAFTCLPGFLFPDPEVRNNPYAYSPYSQFIFSVAAGYYIWDIVVCIQYHWDVGFLAHGLTCFSVFYFALHPFMHHVGRFYLGVYELSTPLLHVYKLMQLGGLSHKPLLNVMGLLFAVVFTNARIICGVPYSIFWAQDMLHLLRSGKAHSVAVVVLYLGSNLTLNLLNGMWWGAIIKIVFKGLTFSKKRTPTGAAPPASGITMTSYYYDLKEGTSPPASSFETTVKRDGIGPRSPPTSPTRRIA